MINNYKQFGNWYNGQLCQRSYRRKRISFFEYMDLIAGKYIASVRDTGESIQGTHNAKKKN